MNVSFHVWKISRKADVNDWQQGVIVFGCAKGHSVKEVADFAGVWKGVAIQVFQQWQKYQSTGNIPQNCARVARTKSGPTALFSGLNIDVAYIQKCVQSMPNQIQL